MENKNKRIDAYIAKSAPFAQPILHHLRAIVHQACPEVKEVIKWNFPNFEYQGIVCNMAAFRQHCSFGFWKAALMTDKHKLFVKEAGSGMGHLGHIKDLADLPSDKILLEYIKEATRLNEAGMRAPRTANRGNKELMIPDYFLKALKKNKKAWKTFQEFSPGNQREYVEWITEAKTDETRTKRLSTAIEWMSEGKIRNWKYITKKISIG